MLERAVDRERTERTQDVNEMQANVTYDIITACKDREASSLDLMRSATDRTVAAL